MVTWVIEKFRGDSSYDDLAAAVRGQGMACHMVDVRAYMDFKREDFGIKFQDCVVVQGSIELSRVLKEKLADCYPVCWLTAENYKCTKYFPKLGKHLFNDKYAMVPAAELQRQKWFYYNTFGKEALIFIRPDDGDKSFKGQLMDLQDFDRFWDNKVANACKPEDIVIVSTPKNIRGEYRFVVSKEGIISHSTYVYQGQITKIPAVPSGAYKKCEEILAEGYHPDSVYTVDIAEDNDGNFWLLEINSFSSAGLYACNMWKVVKEVSLIAEREYKKLTNQGVY